MKHFDDISLLVDRFLDGETTLAEERRLDEFFVSHEAEIGEMSEHLQIVAEMFRELRALSEDTLPASEIKEVCKTTPKFHNWLKWAVAIAAACLVFGIVMFAPNNASTLSEESTIQVAHSPVASPPETTTTQPTESNPTNKQIAEVPKNKPVKKKAKPIDSKSDKEINTSATDTHDIYYEPSMQNDNAMLCGFNPCANMLPMHTDVTTRAVITECEMAILEEEFQKSERNRQTIEI